MWPRPAAAVADVDVLDALDDRGDGLDRILARAVDVARVHIQAEGGGGDRVERAQGRGRVVDGRADMRLDAQDDAVVLGALGEAPEGIDALVKGRLVVALAAGAAVDDGDADLDRGLHGCLHDCRVLVRLLHGQELETRVCGEAADRGRALLPAVDHQMLAHAADGRDLDAVVAGLLDAAEGICHVVAAEQDGICAELHACLLAGKKVIDRAGRACGSGAGAAARARRPVHRTRWPRRCIRAWRARRGPRSAACPWAPGW